MGCNTWDLMDKARYESERGEVMSRMDAMVQAGWRVGRTWGFSLGTGTGQSGALGETVLDPSSVLETAPGAAAPSPPSCTARPRLCQSLSAAWQAQQIRL